MPYIIPSSAVTPGTVYQPGRGVPAYITANARAMACIKGGALSATHMLDQSPRNNGTRRTGEEGRCKKLNGTDQAIRVSDNAAFDWSTVLSVSIWAKNDNADITAANFLIGKYDTGANKREWAFGFNTAEKLQLFFGSSGGASGNIWTSTSAFSPDVWSNYAFTYNAGTLKVFVNGVEIAGSVTSGTIPATLVNQSADLIIGGYLNSNTSTAFWEGQLFDARIYRSILTDSEIADIYEDGANKIQFTGKTLTALYKLDEQSGTTCYDSSGNALNGTIENAADNEATQDILSFQNQVGYNLSGSVYIPRDESDPTNDVLGNPLTYTGRRPNDFKLIGSNCLDLNGTNQAVIIPDSPDFDYTNQLTISIWFKSNLSSILTSSDCVFSKYDSGVNKREWAVTITTDSKIRFSIGSNSGATNNAWTSDDAITIDQWNFLCVSYNGSELAVYLNGVEISGSFTEGSLPATLVNSDCDLLIGGILNSDVPTLEWDGQIVDARIYSRQLSEAEALSIYNDYLNLKNDANLIDRWKCQEGGGIIIYGVNGNHGTIDNAASNWGETQNLVHSNLLEGHIKCYHPTKQVFTGAQASNLRAINFKFISSDPSLYVFTDPVTGRIMISAVAGSSSTSINVGVGGSPVLYIDGSSSWGSTLGDLSNVLCDGNVHDVLIDDILLLTGWPTNGVYINNGTWDITTYLYDLQGFDSNGDPIIPAEPDVRLPAVTSSLGPYSFPLTHPAGDYHNDAETTVGFNPDSTPEMGATQLGITVPASHAFGDAFAASTQIFSRQRTLTEDRFVVMPEAQTGSALATIQKYTQP